MNDRYSADYQEGYARCKSDIIQRLDEAQRMVGVGIKTANDGSTDNPKEARKELMAQAKALRWVRSLLKAQRLGD